MDANEELRHGAPYIGRFAPSPTGPLHFGSLVAAVASYADAKAHDGRWLIRIEDVDEQRCSEAAEREILRQLNVFGLLHDGEIVRQRERGEHYERALTQLRNAGLLFACTCTRKRLGSAPRNSEGETIYPGTCRHLKKSLTGAAERMRADSPGSHIDFDDRSGRHVRQDVGAEVGDFVLKRADGLYAYQLAVVVDDALQGVTDVVRGEDLLLNTPRQILLLRRLGFAQPRYLHVPLVRDDHGEKLSKQTRAQPVDEHDLIATLCRAWSFLRQPAVGPCESVSSFWAQAIARWSPLHLTQTN